jgi:hypothetical protein
MLSFEFEQAYCNVKNGTQLWYGVLKGDIEIYSGIYFKDFSDSTKIFVLSTYSWFKQPKTNMSRKMCNQIKTVIETTINRRTKKTNL